ncbi:MAG: YdcF family protein [Leptolyngbyaceae cyanobacterium SL_7_1]|nr:YdcF family protein [Leptolyngbyaceae cyanobacterium SL_7_1]
MNGFARNRKKRSRRFPLCQLVLVTVLVVAAYPHIRGYVRPPQAVLVLGGATEREDFAALFAQEHPNLPIWVSSGSNPEYTEWVFAEAGIEPTRLRLDYQAVDTVTNFTTLVDEFEAQGINSLYVITSDYHMRRATVIGGIVLWSRGIDFRPIAVPSSREPESIDKVIRDGVRSIVWLVTGHTGSTLGQRWRNQS